ncbi:hypothetical protein N7448_003752 [Penicillium atrosanguineum]|uniref:Uncharacterized protein n=1 Tax=Penicillium atrosanguineum TaxID=1132637 RepID=A0A9W9PWW3_9EURO|nr:hypothetical protein N7448_003752 [Penicillium atrosanguineum]KAJ5315775.1 hypothetical protein N7476_006082 [Penicillium atrosanguineum]
MIRSSVSPDQRNWEKKLDAEPLQKWVEEGFVTVEIEVSENLQSIENGLCQALAALSRHEKCNEKSCYGLIVYSPSLAPDLTPAINNINEIKAIVSYGALLERSQKPHLYYLAESGTKSTDNENVYRYPYVTSTSFILPTHKDFSSSAATVAHTR